MGILIRTLLKAGVQGRSTTHTHTHTHSVFTTPACTMLRDCGGPGIKKAKTEQAKKEKRRSEMARVQRSG